MIPHTASGNQNGRFIVSEVTRNWTRDDPEMLNKPLISQMFAEVVSVNDARGYRLMTVAHSQTHVPPTPDYPNGGLTETIIAVFERRQTGDPSRN